MKRPETHYDDAYFQWQSQNMYIQAKANAFKFEAYVKPAMVVLDFGCGSGALLRELGGGLGVEINPAAREIARKNGIDVYSELSQVEEESVDIVISNHAIEHVERPLDAIREMYRILKPGGRMIIVAPIDAATVPYRQNDKDFHLYSWSAGNLGNLASAAGFEVEKAERILHSWPPSWALIQRTFGWKLFHLFSRLWAIIDWRRRQVRVVARKSQ